MYNEETLYLQQILDIIDKKIESVSSKYDINSKDITSMNEYFWEN